MKIGVDIVQDTLGYLKKDESVVTIQGTSKDLADYLKSHGIKIDMLFIDADHQCDSVIDDFINLESHINRNGIILFHDTFPKSLEYTNPGFCGDAYLAVPKLREIYEDWNFVTLPLHPGLTFAGRNSTKPIWVF